MEEQSFIFYESFYEAVECLDNSDDKLAILDAIINFGLHGEEPDLEGPLFAIFKLIAGGITRAQSRREASRENGAKGGRPRNNPKVTDEEPNKTQENLNKPNKTYNNPTEPEANLNVNVTGSSNVNVNGSSNENVKDNGSVREEGNDKRSTRAQAKSTFGEFNNVKMTDEEYEKLQEKLGTDQRNKYVEDLSYYLYQHPNQKYKDHYRVILKWKDNDSGKGSTNGSGFPKSSANKYDPNKNMIRSGEDYDELMRRNIARLYQ